MEEMFGCIECIHAPEGFGYACRNCKRHLESEIIRIRQNIGKARDNYCSMGISSWHRLDENNSPPIIMFGADENPRLEGDEE